MLSTLLNSSETWSTTKSEGEKLAVLQRVMERPMCGMSARDRVSSKELCQSSGLRLVVNGMYIVKQRWIDHNVRLKDDRWIY